MDHNQQNDPVFKEKLKKEMQKIADGVEAPRRLSPQNLDELLDLRPPKLRMKRMPIFRFAGIAACFVLVVALVLTLNQGLLWDNATTAGQAVMAGGGGESSLAITIEDGNGIDTGLMQSSAMPVDPQWALLESIVERTSVYHDSDVISKMLEQYTLAPGNAGNGVVDGIETGGLMAADDTFLYLAFDRQVEVYALEDLAPVDSVRYTRETVEAVYAVEGQLVVIVSSPGLPSMSVGPHVRMEMFEIPASGGFRVRRRQFVQEGWYLSSARYTQDTQYENHIVLVTQKQLDVQSLFSGGADDSYYSYLPRTSQTMGVEALAPLDESVIHVPEYETIPQYTIVSMLDAANVTKDAQSFAVVGEAYHTYIASEGTYIANKLPLTGETALSRVEFWRGYAFYNERVIEGQLLNAGAIREELNMCKVVTTTDGGRTARYNTFSVVMYPLKTIEIEEQAQPIKDVVLIEDYLYVLPGSEDDVIRVYNTSSHNASMIGEAKSDSLGGTVIRAYGDIYLGLSGGDGPLTVSTYDLRAKESPKLVQSANYGSQGTSAAFADYRTLVNDKDDTGLTFVPVTLQNYKSIDTAGMFTFSVSRSGGLSLVRELRDETPIYAALVRDGILYRATQQHVKAVDVTSYKELASQAFDTAAAS